MPVLSLSCVLPDAGAEAAGTLVPTIDICGRKADSLLLPVVAVESESPELKESYSAGLPSLLSACGAIIGAVAISPPQAAVPSRINPTSTKFSTFISWRLITLSSFGMVKSMQPFAGASKTLRPGVKFPLRGRKEKAPILRELFLGVNYSLPSDRLITDAFAGPGL